jgi:DNA-binding LacI/PurR family transcriptional regulator
VSDNDEQRAAEADGRARVGVREVARAAGVSPQTVSRVLNGHDRIRDETRARVLEAVAALGYRMNNAARSLGTRTTRTLGVLASDVALYGPSAGIAALEAAARARGRWIATAFADAGAAESTAAAVEHLLAQGVDGIVLVAPHARTGADVAAQAPGVRLEVLHGGPGAVRQQEGAALAVAHLAGLGHRRIGELAGPDDWPEAAARSAGVARAVTTQGIAPAARWVGDWSAASAAALAEEIADAVRRGDGPTAIVTANDQMALGLVAGLEARGIRVPEDVSVAGFDDTPDAAYYRPALTTVRLDLVGEARRVVATLLGEAATDAGPPRLEVRASTSPPPP